ncbi:hypothetical protein D9619_003856 [Psilocybe cf. subviscida]|uniref:Uncharacterized protein n=1 Tax=Psilocybe cf. subviscida TaxID=2480587 RepID=A0A8H5AXL3_9AGAR|nr:hypothetical protein D9619_003856 [Psilocybe cf. subviscida]
MERLVGYLPELRACSRTSHALRDEAQRVLFRVVLSATDQRRRAARFFNVIVNSPDRLALYVRVVRLNMTYKLDENLVGLGNAAFRCMINLKHLTVSSMKDSTLGCARILRGMTFKLKGLDLQYRGLEKALLHNFLPAQSQIKYIRLRDWDPEGAGAASIGLQDILPELECLDGPDVALQALLSGHRQIRAVVWDRSSGVYHHELPAFHSAQYQEGLGRIEYLSYRMFRVSNITNISPLLVSLRVLELCGYEITDLQVLEDLPRIEHLILSADSAWKGRYSSPTLSVQLCKHAFKLSKTLECLDIREMDTVLYMQLRREDFDDVSCIQQVEPEDVRLWSSVTQDDTLDAN